MNRVLDLLSRHYDIELLLGVEDTPLELRRRLSEELRKLDEEMDLLLERDSYEQQPYSRRRAS